MKDDKSGLKIKMSFKLSVIVPVYNTAPYIERCIRSLMEQTLDDIEYIIINDASPDNAIEIAMKIIEEYPHRKPFVKIINHTNNKGIAYTRQEGHDAASGEYIIHCDSDDWVDSRYYEALYDKGIAENADIVTGKLVIDVDKVNFHQVYEIPCFTDWNDFLDAKQHYILSLCRHMFRKQFIEEYNLRFDPNINYAEDDHFVFRSYYYSMRNASIVYNLFYHYQKDNDNSMTCNRFSIHTLDNKARCLQSLSGFVKCTGNNPLRSVFLNDEKRMTKEGYLLSSPPDFNRWHKAFPEVTPKVLRDSHLSIPYRLAWALGQYIHSSLFKCFLNRKI